MMHSESLNALCLVILIISEITSIFIEGESAIIDIMKHLLRENENEIITMDCWDLQVFLGRKMYEQAIEKNKFFPPIK